MQIVYVCGTRTTSNGSFEINCSYRMKALKRRRLTYSFICKHLLQSPGKMQNKSLIYWAECIYKTGAFMILGDNSKIQKNDLWEEELNHFYMKLGMFCETPYFTDPFQCLL